MKKKKKRFIKIYQSTERIVTLNYNFNPALFMKRFAKILFPLLSSFIFLGCQDCITGEGKPIKETRTVESFDQLDLSSSLDVSLIQVTNLSAHKVILQAQENVLPHLICEVDNGKLEIGIAGCTIDAKDLEAATFFSELTNINTSGSGNINSENPIFCKRLTIESEGSGNVNFDFIGDMLVINTNGSGDFKIKGKCKDLLLTSNGSGKIDLIDLSSDRIKIESNGSGNISTWAVRKANLELNGSGDVSLKGDPQDLQQKRNGSGKIKRID